MNANITAENWPEIVRRVHTAMAEHVGPYLASISRTHDNKSGKAHGSGIYVAMKKEPGLATCEHVVRTGYESGYRITHLPKDGGYYHAFNREWLAEPYPVDLALTYIDPAIWSEGDREALSRDRIAERGGIAANELLMLCGYPGEASSFKGYPPPELQSNLVPYTARATALPADFVPDMHFALQYEMNLAESVNGSGKKLPSPGGFSGSPIWDTRFVASGCSDDWTPAQARVIGMACRWLREESCIIGVKSEVLARFLSDLDSAA
jgi:hypothetical protein